MTENTQWNVSEKRALKATYYNIHSKTENTTLEWFSSNTAVLKITGDSVEAIGVGEAFLYAKKNDIFSDSTGTIEVLNTDIFISLRKKKILKETSTQVSILIKKATLKDKTILWNSSNESIATIDNTGKITGIKVGTSKITAEIDGIISNSITITVTELKSKTAFFTTTTSYTTERTAILRETIDGKLELEFQEDANIQNGPSLYLLLANKTEPPYTLKTDGTSLAIDGISVQLTANRLSEGIDGKKGKKIYSIPANISIDDYKYVVFYCTFGPVFGSAELK